MSEAPQPAEKPTPQPGRAIDSAIYVVASLVVILILFFLWSLSAFVFVSSVAAYVLGIGALVMFAVRLGIVEWLRNTLVAFGQRGWHQLMIATRRSAKKPKLRWYQYRLSHLFVLTGVVAVVCACAASYWNWCLRDDYRFEREIAPIREVGGNVSRSPDSRVTEIRFVQLSDADLRTLREHLESLSSLKGLHLRGTQVTDAGLEYLKGMTNLKRLYLQNTQITDAGLVHLQGLTNLEGLSLPPRATDTGLKHLQRLTTLEWLHLGETQVTDAGLECLQAWTKLERLYLNDTQISDAGLEHLKGVTNLRSLDLHRTQVSDDGVEKLQKALPKCRVYR